LVPAQAQESSSIFLRTGLEDIDGETLEEHRKLDLTRWGNHSGPRHSLGFVVFRRWDKLKALWRGLYEGIRT
jgi:hypothetical protein